MAIDDKFVRDRITALRLSKGISEVELSLALGLSKNYINNLVNHSGYPSMQTFIDLCDYFGITPVEFFYDALDDPQNAMNIYAELARLCHGNTKKMLAVLQSADSADLDAFLSFLEKYVEKTKRK